MWFLFVFIGLFGVICVMGVYVFLFVVIWYYVVISAYYWLLVVLLGKFYHELQIYISGIMDFYLFYHILGRSLYTQFIIKYFSHTPCVFDENVFFASLGFFS